MKQRIITLFILLLVGNLLYSEILLTDKKSKKEKKQKLQTSNNSIGSAIAKNNVVIQPGINLGYHSGFKKLNSSYGYAYAYTGLIPGISLNIDYAVHKYASVGVFYGIAFQKYTVSNVVFLGHAFGARTIFHWWQLMADKTGKNLFADKIDFDIHAHIGGFLVQEKNLNTNVKAKHIGVNAGGGIGFKYYFVKQFGVSIDAGYEELSWFKFGLAIKI